MQNVLTLSLIIALSGLKKIIYRGEKTERSNAVAANSVVYVTKRI